MLIGIIGENCTGKSTLAEELKAIIGGDVFTGKDYLRMAKSESEAVRIFKEKLADAASGNGNVIYVITEKEHAALLPEGAVRVLATADLETKKERFRERVHGNLPAPAEKMIETKDGMFDGGDYDLRYDSTKDDPKAFALRITEKM